jgi:hypothetical protein
LFDELTTDVLASSLYKLGPTAFNHLSIAGRVSVAAETCLSSRYQAVAVFVSRHVTVCIALRERLMCEALGQLERRAHMIKKKNSRTTIGGKS